MGEEDHGGWSPTGAPVNLQRDEHWRHFGNSVNAVSCGFVATAILISMFLVMAIFERFLRPTSTPSGDRSQADVVSQMGYHGKLSHPSPRIPMKATEISVLMPGEATPTYIAQPAPVPCPLERVPWPPHNRV